jgi:hypothetical protein
MDTGHEQRDGRSEADTPRPDRRSWKEAPRDALVATTSVVALFLIAILALGWRLTRPLEPLPPSGLWLLSLLLLAGGFLLGGLRIHQDVSASPAVGRWVFWMAWVSVGLLALALSVPGTAPLALGALWLVVGVLLVFLSKCPGAAVVPPSVSTMSSMDPPAQSTVSLLEDNTEPLIDEGTLPEGVDQEIVRLIDAEMGTVIQGRLRVPFEAGQRTASVHVAFCPPLRKVPSVAVEVLSGPDGTAKVGVSLVQGARFDVRLEQPTSEATAVTVAFFAQESSAEVTEPGPPFHTP